MIIPFIKIMQQLFGFVPSQDRKRNITLRYPLRVNHITNIFDMISNNGFFSIELFWI